MYLNPNQFATAFKSIKTTSLSHSTCKLVIYASCLSIDALCGAKILSMLFKSQLIPYQLIPVVGYSDLKSHYEKLDEDITNILLVGCGAMVDVETFFGIEPEEFLEREEGKMHFKRRIYVIDGHRPWNLDNVFGSDMVCCLDDGHVDEDLKMEKESYLKLLAMEQQAEVVEEDGVEQEKQDESEKDEIDQDDSEKDEIDQDSDIEVHVDSRKRKKDEIIADCEESLEKYYAQGATITTSVTAQIYSLLSSLKDNEATVDTLWLSIVGTTSLSYNYPQVYKKLYPIFRDEVTRMSLNSSTGQRRQNGDVSYIAIDKDYYLFLLRHWSLYSSFLYSNYVNSKLLLWQEEGRKKLNKMFAKMGISLQIANQNWLYMDIEIKRKLNQIFKKYLGLYDLEDLVREGFVRHYGYKGSISASEYVESLVALLQHNEDDVAGLAVTEEDKENHEDEDRADNLIHENEQEEITGKLVEKEKKWVSNFWSAWDALSTERITLKKSTNKKVDGIDLINKGLDIAKEYQQIVFKTGVMIMEKKLIKNLRVFRLIVLKDESIPNLNFYRNPLNLTRLGNWVLESLAEIDYQPLLPLVLAALDLETDTYLVVGLAPLYPRSTVDDPTGKDRRKRKKTKRNKNDDNADDEEETLNGIDKVLLNTFSTAFQLVANTTGAKVRIDNFESSVIEIRKDDLSPFLEKLTLCGLV